MRRRKRKPSPAYLAALDRLKASGRLDAIRREVSATTAVRLAKAEREQERAERGKGLAGMLVVPAFFLGGQGGSRCDGLLSC